MVGDEKNPHGMELSRKLESDVTFLYEIESHSD